MPLGSPDILTYIRRVPRPLSLRPSFTQTVSPTPIVSDDASPFPSPPFSLLCTDPASHPSFAIQIHSYQAVSPLQLNFSPEMAGPPSSRKGHNRQHPPKVRLYSRLNPFSLLIGSRLPTVVVHPPPITRHQPERNMPQLHPRTLQKLALSSTPCCSPS